MMLRVNKPDNVQTYAGPGGAHGGLRARIRSRDIFVVNTRYAGSKRSEWEKIVTGLHESFPCNRIVSLNGLGGRPGRPGDSAALIDRPEVSTLMLDWELYDWNKGRRRSTPAWDSRFGVARARAAKRLAALAKRSSISTPPDGRRVGLVPATYADWDYGLIAKTADRRNHQVRGRRRAFQAVQTQGFCQAGADSFDSVSAGLLDQYTPPPRRKRLPGPKKKKPRYRKVNVKPRASERNLALEVSFSNTPDPGSSLPVASVSPGLASKCVRRALRRGGGGFLFWAHPDSVRALVKTRRVCVLRPPPAGRRAC